MKLITNAFLMVLIMISFSQCSSAQKLQKETPIKLQTTYYQHWVAGIKGGGSGINIFILTENSELKNIQLDSVYFRGKASKLEVKPNNPNLFIGRFLLTPKQKRDVIMSNKPKAEYGNELLKLKEKIPFELKENECVVSYKEESKIKYFKIKNVVEKQPQYYPSAPPKPKTP